MIGKFVRLCPLWWEYDRCYPLRGVWCGVVFVCVEYDTMFQLEEEGGWSLTIRTSKIDVTAEWTHFLSSVETNDPSCHLRGMWCNVVVVFVEYDTMCQLQEEEGGR